MRRSRRVAFWSGPGAPAERVLVPPALLQLRTEAINYFDFGPQNSRGFRALKIWLAFQQAGRSGFRQTIADDIALASTPSGCSTRILISKRSREI